METLGEKSTTTPKVHFGNKHPITELKVLSRVQITIKIVISQM